MKISEDIADPDDTNFQMLKYVMVICIKVTLFSSHLIAIKISYSHDGGCLS